LPLSVPNKKDEPFHIGQPTLTAPNPPWRQCLPRQRPDNRTGLHYRRRDGRGVPAQRRRGGRKEQSPDASPEGNPQSSWEFELDRGLRFYWRWHRQGLWSQTRKLHGHPVLRGHCTVFRCPTAAMTVRACLKWRIVLGGFRIRQDADVRCYPGILSSSRCRGLIALHSTAVTPGDAGARKRSENAIGA